MVKHFTELRAWQKAHALVLGVYVVSKAFPKDEVYGLTNQMRRAAVSVPSNIAEGFGRNKLNDKVHFLFIARGSITELHTQLLLAEDLNYIEKVKNQEIIQLLSETHRLINALIRSLQEIS